MCTIVYIGSEKQLQLIGWNEEDPGLGIYEVKENYLSMIKPILNSNFIYEATSHLGCACGLSYFENYKDNSNENYNQRVKDVNDLLNYLKKYKFNNSLKLFCTSWGSDEFLENYSTIDYDISSLDLTEFYLPDLEILNIK